MEHDDNILITGTETAKRYVLHMLSKLTHEIKDDLGRRPLFKFEYCIVKTKDLAQLVKKEEVKS
jgi:hypothetical protein